MPQVFVYIRNDDMDAWRAIEKKSQFIHDALSELHRKNEDSTLSGFVNVDTSPMDFALEAMATDEREQSDAFYANLVLDQTGNSGVWDTTTGEQVEADPDMIKELKRRKQVK